MGDVLNHLAGLYRELAKEQKDKFIQDFIGGVEVNPGNASDLGLTSESDKFVAEHRHLGRIELGEGVGAHVDVESLCRTIWLERINQAKLEERQRIAAELHDDVCQQIVALKIAAQLSLTKSTDCTQQDNLRQSLLGGLDRLLLSVRSVSANVQGYLPQDITLDLALRQLAEQMLSAAAVKFDLTINGDINSCVSELALCVYRVVQEGLSNIVRHAHASYVLIHISAGSAGVKLQLRDNGVGYMAQGTGAVSSGCGLLNMQRRARDLAGFVHIVSNLDSGTQITLWLPAVPGRTSGSGAH